MRDSLKRRKALKRAATAKALSPAHKQRVSTGIICTLLVGIVWIVFGQTLRHEFINYDDDQYVYKNSRITNGLNLEGIGWAFTHVHADNWHPLTTISHMLDCQLYGLQPWGHHLTNLLLHAAAAICLFLALWQLTGARWPSAFVAAVFAIHPLRVESVAWVSERKDVLSGVFFMLTLWAYARYARSSRPTPARYTTVVVLFALGLMCKPTLVTLPFVLLLLDYWPLRRFAQQSPSSKPSRSVRDHVAIRRGENPSRDGPLPTKSITYLLVEKIPFLVLSAASCVATLLAQEKTIATLRLFTFGERVGNAMVSYGAYIGQMIWPAGLSAVYPYPADGLNIAQALVASLVLLIISVVFFIWRGRYAFLWIGWLWFLGILVPMIGIVQVGAQARADRYTYLAQIGLYLLITWGALELFTKWRGGRQVLIAVAGLIVTGLMAGSYLQTSFWRDSETLWNQALVHNPDNYIAQSNLGAALVTKGKLDDAVVHLRRAVEIFLNYPDAYNLGDALMKKGQFDEAVIYFRKALELNADYPETSISLGYVLMKTGQLDEAVVHLRKALEIYANHPGDMGPNYPITHHTLAVCLAGIGKTDEAIEHFREALRLNGDYQDAHCNLASVLLQLGRRDEAVLHLREALRIKPDDAEVEAQLRQLGVER